MHFLVPPNLQCMVDTEEHRVLLGMYRICLYCCVFVCECIEYVFIVLCVCVRIVVCGGGMADGCGTWTSPLLFGSETCPLLSFVCGVKSTVLSVAQPIVKVLLRTRLPHQTTPTSFMILWKSSVCAMAGENVLGTSDGADWVDLPLGKHHVTCKKPLIIR